jgi:predicted Rossmann fold flavoprotein
MKPRTVAIVGGGAAGIFAAIACAQTAARPKVTVFEKGPQFLAKVRISGGGRCNVTHACFEPRDLATAFPRGERALISPLHRFHAADTIAWFEARGVKLKVESDGRVFPVTDSSETIIHCLLTEARAAGVELVANRGVQKISRQNGNMFEITLSNGDIHSFNCLLLATGGCRTRALGELAVSLGHTLEPPVPSLFTFHVELPWIRELSGVAVQSVEAGIPDSGLHEQGPLLLTHLGLSGPVILRLSAWGARKLHELNYRFALHVNWLPELTVERLSQRFAASRQAQPARFIVNSPPTQLPARLWERLVLASGIPRERRWSVLSRQEQHQLIQQLVRTEFPVTGKSLNKDEFVTCGGVRLEQVDFRTMQSRVCPGLFFAGELLDIDGITGGFNFQAAWTTGLIAGQAMGEQ